MIRVVSYFYSYVYIYTFICSSYTIYVTCPMFSSFPCTVLLECGSCCIVLSSPTPLWLRHSSKLLKLLSCTNYFLYQLCGSLKQPPEALSDDFLFPMTSRLSYASSPESDLETGPESRTPSKSLHHHPPPHNMYPDSREPRGRMVKSSSDPSLAAPEDTEPNAYGGPPPYTASPTRIVSVILLIVSCYLTSTFTAIIYSSRIAALNTTYHNCKFCCGFVVSHIPAPFPHLTLTVSWWWSIIISVDLMSFSFNYVLGMFCYFLF